MNKESLSMQYIIQFIIIMVYVYLGEFISTYIPFPLPGSVIGLILLYISLELKIIKLKQVDETATFLKNNMTIMFIPLTVSIMNSYDILHRNLFPLVITLIISTTITMIVVGKFADRKERM